MLDFFTYRVETTDIFKIQWSVQNWPHQNLSQVLRWIGHFKMVKENC